MLIEFFPNYQEFLLNKNYFAHNLQNKVMCLFLLSTLLPLGLVGKFSVKTAEDLIVKMVSSQLESVIEDKVAILEHWLLERKADILVVAGSSILQSMNPDLIKSYLELVGKNYKTYKELLVISSEEKVIFNNASKATNFWKDSYNEPFKSALYISDIKLHPEEHESIFIISAPIVGNEKQMKGTIHATVGTSTILNIILNVSLGKTGECYLVNKNGTFLAHKEPHRILKENIAQSGSFKKIFTKKELETVYLDYRGIEVLCTSRKVKNTDWYLVVEQDRDEAFKSADILKRYVYIMIAFTISIAVFISWLISYYIVNPIRTLSQSANILADGEFDKAILKTNRQDEIGFLYMAFSNMASQLKQRQHSLLSEVDLKDAELKETGIILRKTRMVAIRSEKFAAIGRMSAGVTHEIRTPLTSIKLFLESLQSEIEISPEYEEDFNIAMQQIKRIESTINRFLDFTKPQELRFSTIDIHQIIESALFVIRPMPNKQECVVNVSFENDLPLIKGDKKLLGDAMINLLINSLEAMDSAGKLEIHVKKEQSEINAKIIQCIRIDISDNGPGIPDDQLLNIFEPYFTTKSSGTGLGLSLAYNTIQRHGGIIQVKSGDIRGTIFSVFLSINIPIEEFYGKNTNY
jgi:signal transduction histidine kinase